MRERFRTCGETQADDQGRELPLHRRWIGETVAVMKAVPWDRIYTVTLGDEPRARH